MGDNSPCIKEINTNANTHLHKETSTESQTHPDDLSRVRFWLPLCTFLFPMFHTEKNTLLKLKLWTAGSAVKGGRHSHGSGRWGLVMLPSPGGRAGWANSNAYTVGPFASAQRSRFSGDFQLQGWREGPETRLPVLCWRLRLTNEVCVDWSTRKCHPGGHSQLLFDGEQWGFKT